MAAVMATTLCGIVAAGCYTYVPSEGSHLVPGRQVALDLNDLGRLNLTSLIGGDVTRLAGTLVEQSATEYTLKTTKVTFLNGRTAEWSGEPVTLKQEYVRGVYEQKLSPSKSAAVAVAAAAGIVGGIIAGVGLTGIGTSSDTKKPPPPPPNTNRGHQ